MHASFGLCLFCSVPAPSAYPEGLTYFRCHCGRSASFIEFSWTRGKILRPLRLCPLRFCLSLFSYNIFNEAMQEVVHIMESNFSTAFHNTDGYKKLEKKVQNEADELERLRKVCLRSLSLLHGTSPFVCVLFIYLFFWGGGGCIVPPVDQAIMVSPAGLTKRFGVFSSELLVPGVKC